MTARAQLMRILQQEDINFLLTNRIPRRWLTRLVGRLSRIERPWFCAAAIAVWRLFSDLDLSEAKKDRFTSLHECFTRELKAGARPIDADPDVLTSPCDALVGACGRVEGGMVLQAKGFPYPLGGPARRRCGAGRLLSARAVRDAAAHLEHVSPLPCAL